MSCYMTYVQNMLYNMCHVMLYNICHVMLYDICSEQNMLYNMCHVMLYNICHVMLSRITYIMLCYIAYVQNMFYHRTEHVI